MAFNTIIVEDEMHTARMLESMIKELRPEWKVLDIFDSISETVEWLQNNEHPNLIFLDIQLADGLSFSIFDKVEVKSAIIFTTAYDEYAVKAFKLNSIDYILKPVKEESLLAAIKKMENVMQLFENENQININYAELVKGIKEGEAKYRKRFLVSKRDAFFAVPVEDVAYIYFEAKTTYAVTFDKKQHMINFTLDKLEEELDPAVFIRANRQAIVNLKAIHSLENYFGGKLVVKLLPQFDEKFVVSRAKASVFKEWLDS
ncbi:LytR/AlgR family response regulator transcription factor [Saccharicrinis fermentans]|uniref:Sensory transduction protein LytR n=1 Tax=Saccharicrinis fermentans DSM 9555 = JCM 21142 TaxID=869213 RepID=W7Y0G9_9BACT|nr:LytTR family DNA-binding domain-containing protein [Saccharicrinis fermentans]GAF01442.1 sensory transduction protein LytR [Saccharicrinis fermentans DSM 9555 = JCM 21142]